jgi:hypothetical protein
VQGAIVAYVPPLPLPLHPFTISSLDVCVLPDLDDMHLQCFTHSLICPLHIHAHTYNSHSSQVGFCCAYLIFISENIDSLTGDGVTKKGAVLGVLIPMCFLVNIRDLSELGTVLSSL